MPIQIICKKSDFKHVLKHLRVGKTKRRKDALKIFCEITVTDGNATFALPGSVFSIKCQTIGTAKATVLYFQLFDIIDTIDDDQIEMTITEGSLKINMVTVNANTCFFKDDRILRTIRLPLNYNEADLLRLVQQGYTEQELLFNKLYFKFERAQKSIETAINSAYLKLKLYGVTRAEIMNLVEKKLYNSPEV